MAQNFTKAQVTLPAGACAGMPLQIQIGDGKKYQITLPPGARPGQTIMVQIPKQPPVVQATRAAPASSYPGHTQQSFVARPAVAPSVPLVQPPAATPSRSSPVLWHGWFLKQQPHFPHTFQRRYGSLVARSGGGFELVYYSSDTEMHTGIRRGALPAMWKRPTSAAEPLFGRYCLDGVPTRDGKLPLVLRTAERDYCIHICPIESAARFYAAFRIHVCGDSPAQVHRALKGAGIEGSGEVADPGILHAALSGLYEEQMRIAAMGYDRFVAAAALSRHGGDGDGALSDLVSGGTAALDSPQSGANRASGPAPVSWAPTSAPRSAAAASSLAFNSSDLVAMGFDTTEAAEAAAAHSDLEAAVLWLVGRRDRPVAGATGPPPRPASRPPPRPPAARPPPPAVSTAGASGSGPSGAEYELEFGNGPLSVSVEVADGSAGPWPRVSSAQGPESGCPAHLNVSHFNGHLPRVGHAVRAFKLPGAARFTTLSGSTDNVGSSTAAPGCGRSLHAALRVFACCAVHTEVNHSCGAPCPLPRRCTTS